MFYMTELSPNALEEHENIALNAKTGGVKITHKFSSEVPDG